MDIHDQVAQAHDRIRGRIRETPLEFSTELSRMVGGSVHLKLENLQHTGSFKLRGAANKLACLPATTRSAGVVAASTGNHGAAVAFGARQDGIQAIVFAPENASPEKLRNVESLGAEVRRVGEDCLVAERAARTFAAEHSMEYISPYNDPDVVAGQGTVGSELVAQLEEFDAVISSVGGGGLLGGIGGFLAGSGRTVEVIGCSPRNSSVMHASLRAGEILDLPSDPTLSDGTAGGIEPDTITFPLCQQVIDRFTLVTEAEIRAALRVVVGRHHMMIEGAAAAAVAALLQEPEHFAGRSTVVVLCGANIDPRTFAEVLLEDG